MFILYNVILFYMYFPKKLTLLGTVSLYVISIIFSPIIILFTLLLTILMSMVDILILPFGIILVKGYNIEKYKEDFVLMFSWKRAKVIARYNYFGEI